MSVFIRCLACCLLLMSFNAPQAAAQDTEMSPETSPEMMAMMAAWQKAATPGEQHASMAKQIGTWNAKVSTWIEPGAEPMVSEGTFERELILGGRVLAESYNGNVMGMPFEGHSLGGYDNVTGRWWTMWTDNMSTGPMVMWGEWNDQEKGIVYVGKTPDPMSGSLIDMKTIVRHPNEDEEVMAMYDLRSGKAVKTMEIVAKRQ